MDWLGKQRGDGHSVSEGRGKMEPGRTGECGGIECRVPARLLYLGGFGDHSAGFVDEETQQYGATDSLLIESGRISDGRFRVNGNRLRQPGAPL